MQAPDHKYVYAPVPPETVAVNTEDWFICIEPGLAEHETKIGLLLTATAQLADTACDPEITVIDAVCVPAVE